jgi:hypothetical protein
MQAVIETRQDGTVAMELDPEAARAVAASIVFASRFHEGILPLAGMVEASIEQDDDCAKRRALCQ